MEIIKALEWRHASKKMSGQAVSQEKVDIILRAIQLAPTSMGLQPFTVLVITDPEMKKQIQPICLWPNANNRLFTFAGICCLGRHHTRASGYIYNPYRSNEKYA